MSKQGTCDTTSAVPYMKMLSDATRRVKTLLKLEIGFRHVLQKAPQEKSTYNCIYECSAIICIAKLI